MEAGLASQVLAGHGDGHRQGVAGHRVLAPQRRFVDHGADRLGVQFARGDPQRQRVPARHVTGPAEFRADDFRHQGDGVLREDIQAGPRVGAAAEGENGGLPTRVRIASLVGSRLRPRAFQECCVECGHTTRKLIGYFFAGKAKNLTVRGGTTILRASIPWRGEMAQWARNPPRFASPCGSGLG